MQSSTKLGIGLAGLVVLYFVFRGPRTLIDHMQVGDIATVKLSDVQSAEADPSKAQLLGISLSAMLNSSGGPGVVQSFPVSSLPDAQGNVSSVLVFGTSTFAVKFPAGSIVGLSRNGVPV